MSHATTTIAFSSEDQLTAPTTGSFSAVSHDVDEQEQLLVDWVETYHQITPGPFEGRLQQTLLGNLQIFRETTSQAIHQTGNAWDNALCVAALATPCEPVRWRGTPIGPREIACFHSAQEIDLITPQHCDIVAVAVDAQEFALFAEEVEAIDFDSSPLATATSLADQTNLQHFLLSTLAATAANPSALHCPTSTKLLRESVYAALVAALAVNAGMQPLMGPHSRVALVNRARTFLHDRSNEVVSIADVCRDLKVSRRTLQYAFQDVLGINPIAYSRALRLNGVRRALKSPAKGEGILDLAAQWGFWHPSHFRNDYKLMFGELPSETMKRFN